VRANNATLAKSCKRLFLSEVRARGQEINFAGRGFLLEQLILSLLTARLRITSPLADLRRRNGQLRPKLRSNYMVYFGKLSCKNINASFMQNYTVLLFAIAAVLLS